MKDTILRYLFWIILLVILIGIGIVHMVMVLPLKKEVNDLETRLDKQLKEMGSYAKNPKLKNEGWFRSAQRHVNEVKSQKEQCYGFVEQFKYDWEQPIEGAAPQPGQPFVDKAVFRFAYKDYKKDFEETARTLIKFDVENPPFIWPELRPEDLENKILWMQRYCRVQEHFLEVLVAGKVGELQKLQFGDLKEYDKGKEVHQDCDFTVKLKIIFEDVPVLVSEIMSLKRKFLCDIASISVSPIPNTFPTIRKEQAFLEPPVQVLIVGKMSLFTLDAEERKRIQQQKKKEEDKKKKNEKSKPEEAKKVSFVAEAAPIFS